MGTLTTIQPQSAAALRRSAFDDRYGEGSHERLLQLLAQPCISFARIATHYDVSRECVRMWHRQWLPDAPTGQERRRQCAGYQEKRRLLLDPVFRAFHRDARAWFGADRIHPLRSRRGYRTRTVRIDHYTVVLRDALTSAPRFRGRADFIYFRLPGDEFLFVAGSDIPGAAHPRNTFAALATDAGHVSAPPIVTEQSKEQSL